MSRGGKHIERVEVERKCIALGQVRPTRHMIRFVIGPNGEVVPDILGKLPGRGIWVSSRKAALEKASGKGLFNRAAKQSVQCPPDLPRRVEDALVARVQNLISLSRKSGKAIAGFEKVKAWLEKDEAKVLIQASDGSERGKGKLRPPDEPDSFIGVLTANELGLAFGRENVIHGALASGGLTNLVVEEAARLKGLRVADGGKKPTGKDKKSR